MCFILFFFNFFSKFHNSTWKNTWYHTCVETKTRLMHWDFSSHLFLIELIILLFASSHSSIQSRLGFVPFDYLSYNCFNCLFFFFSYFFFCAFYFILFTHPTSKHNILFLNLSSNRFMHLIIWIFNFLRIVLTFNHKN